MAEEHITASPIVSTTSVDTAESRVFDAGKAAGEASDSVWHVIHGGQERGPLSIAELAEKAAAGEVEPHDLVKATGGQWTKARDLGFLQQEFLLKESREKALNELGRFHGVWISRNALFMGGCVLLALFSFAVVWAIIKPNHVDPPAPPLREVVREIVKELPVESPREQLKKRADRFNREFQERLANGQFLNPAEAYELIGKDPDKVEHYNAGVVIPDFNSRDNYRALVARFFPFEVPGVAAPRYRLNLLFLNYVNPEKEPGLPLTNYILVSCFVRSPD